MPEGPHWTHYDPLRNSWMCMDNVEHTDHSHRVWSTLDSLSGLCLVPNTVCDGCCSRDDFPGQNMSKTIARRKAMQLDIPRRYADAEGVL